MAVITLQAALFHSAPRLELDQEMLRLVLPTVFGSNWEVPLRAVTWVDRDLDQPGPVPVPAIVPRVLTLRTGSLANHRPNLVLVFDHPTPVPEIKRMQAGTLPFSTDRARGGGVWVDAVIVGCSKPRLAQQCLRGTHLPAHPSLQAAVAHAYGVASDDTTDARELLGGRGDFWYRAEPVLRGTA